MSNLSAVIDAATEAKAYTFMVVAEYGETSTITPSTDFFAAHAYAKRLTREGATRTFVRDFDAAIYAEFKKEAN